MGDNRGLVKTPANPPISGQLETENVLERLKSVNVHLSSRYEYWFVLICMEMNIISNHSAVISDAFSVSWPVISLDN